MEGDVALSSGTNCAAFLIDNVDLRQVNSYSKLRYLKRREMMDSSNIASAMKHIGKHYTFTSEYYPILDQLSPTQRKMFAVNHNHLHMSKSLGKIAAECEVFDHSGTINHAALEKATVKMFINTLKLAEELGMSASDLCSKVPKFTRNE